MDEAAEPVPALDGGSWWVRGVGSARGRLRWCEIQRTVRPMSVVVVDEGAEYTFEVAAVYD